MNGRPSEHIRELARTYQRTGDRHVRNEILGYHLDLADLYAKRVAKSGAPFEDLRQVALLAMVRAVDRFDPDLGVEFSTFASRTIDGELKRYMRDKTWTVRPARSAHDLHLAVRATTDELTQAFGRSPTVHELAERLDTDVDHIVEALAVSQLRTTRSLDAPVGGDDSDLSLGEATLGAPELGYAHTETHLVLTDLLHELDDRDRRIIHLRFFESKSQDEIAAELGISQSYLSRVLKRVLAQLRARLESEPAAGTEYLP